ncbi:MAG: metal-sulfur cluster assembly factor [Verrucomicrobia bacterium]|nr:metal-sulfur cluster assembly factor [Verrucomicrobiota bacterium]
MTSIDPRQVEDALRQVVDPELGCNLMDLGLIYSTDITGDTVRVTMTLTTQGCPMHESLVEGVRAVLLDLAGVREVAVDVVWDPPWNPAMMTPAGRARVGLA